MADFPGQFLFLALMSSMMKKNGDLTRDEAIMLWTRLLRAGLVAAILGGPPCETWSIARFRPPMPRADGSVTRHPPVPLRMRGQLLGLKSINMRERAQ
eukprot:742039-Pyramimonas_sp.AAC.1